jgi:hypothetical protein
MTRSLLLTIALAVSCLGAATGGFLAGRSNGPDLSVVARAGTSSGARSGAQAGARAGRRAGYRVGYDDAYRPAYSRAYRAASKRALGG